MTIGLEARSLTKLFSHLGAVDEVDLEVHAGQVTALLDRNGAGKTTLLRLLSTLISPSSDQLTVAGHDACAAPHAVRRLLGWVGQHPTVEPLLTVRENLLILAGSAAYRSPI